MVNVYLLLGGMGGEDGYLDSAGMEGLGEQLKALPNVQVSTFSWDQWQLALEPIQHPHGKVAVIGYSGGGSRATYLADAVHGAIIDLLILYDPSPKWQMRPIEKNVLNAICYHNTAPMMFFPLVGELGGGMLTLAAGNTTTKLVTQDIAIQHLLVQNDADLHAKTVAAVKELTNA